MAAVGRKLDADVTGPAALPEFGRVRLLRDLVYRGTRFPKGSTGIVVEIHGGGVAYEVEFSVPKEEVVDVRRENLQAA